MMEALCSLVMLGGVLFLSQLSPGPDLFFVFRTALAQGARAGSAVGSGITLGFLIQAVLVAWIGGWLMAQPWSHWVLYAASAWLLYLAWRIFPRHRVEVWGDKLETRERSSLAALFAQVFPSALSSSSARLMPGMHRRLCWCFRGRVWWAGASGACCCSGLLCGASTCATPRELMPRLPCCWHFLRSGWLCRCRIWPVRLFGACIFGLLAVE